MYNKIWWGEILELHGLKELRLGVGLLLGKYRELLLGDRRKSGHRAKPRHLVLDAQELVALRDDHASGLARGAPLRGCVRHLVPLFGHG